MGRPAARINDMHTCPQKEGGRSHEGGPILEGSPNVFFNGLSAARVGDRVHCNGSDDETAEGEPTVFINCKPAVRKGDKTAHDGVITKGSDNIFIGTSSQGRCAQSAAKSGASHITIKQ
jgi:uncharacterized Zn-binding protein involved in type VI secretion